MIMESVRLNKYLSMRGICSRREADRRIAAGEITIDGRTAMMGERVTGLERICFSDRLIGEEEKGQETEPVLLVVNKPCGVVCTASDKDRAPNVVEMVGYPSRIYPVGRLDKDSEGLPLMTNQGELANKIMHAGSLHEKEYVVTVDRPLQETFLKKMREGVELKELGETTRPCLVKQEGARRFRIVLTQGLNRQIRRMCQALGFRVVTLKRVRIMNIHLGKLQPGEFRKATKDEWKELVRRVYGKDGVWPEIW